MLSSQVRLTFAAITEAQMLLILAHYQGQQGTFQSFPLPSAIWSGVSDATDYQLTGYGWRYINPPSVSDAMCANAYDVELTLETVPPEGTAIAGLDFLVISSLTAGQAAAADGMTTSVAVSLTAGLPNVQFDFTVIASLAAGDATADAAVSGLDESVTWTLDQVETDPDFSNVSLLLHMDGSNGGTTFTDSSSNAHSITAFGNAQVSTTDPKYGTGALLLDGNGDYLQTPADADFAFGTGDFTVECWCYATVVSDNDGLFTFGGTSSGLFLALFNSGWWLGTAGGGGSYMGPATADLNTWRHVAVTRSGTSLRLFIDGVQKGSTLTNSTNLTDNQLKIGYYFGTIYGFVGKIDEFRVTKGVARYTANFTPPTAPFPDS